MAEKKYLYVVDCHEKEDHDGEHWITEEELEQLKEKSKKGEVGLNCARCNVRIEDSEGNLVFSHCKIDD